MRSILEENEKFLMYLRPEAVRTGAGPGQAPIHFKEETLSLCHPERSEGSLAGPRSFAALRMTLLKRLGLTRTEILRCAQDDTAEAVWFDSQNVFFEMD